MSGASNVLIAQSGGPSPVINASLQGVIDACRGDRWRFGRILAGEHGIEGILQEHLLDIDQEDLQEVARLRYTPGAGAIGSCRYKLSEDNREDFERLVAVMRAHDIGWFFYIGGNDSMDTADKVNRLAAERGLDLRVVGVPKTIDNDVGDERFDLVDHTPGYGSTARYWAMVTQIADEENRSMRPSESVVVLQAMGRRAGFIPAAARLADPQRRLPLQIYLSESGYNLPAMADLVADELRTRGRCIVVVSEGFDVSAAGDLGATHDAFGHIEYGASRATVAQQVVNYLNDAGLPVRGNAVGQVPGVLQRSTSVFASSVDRQEAYRVGVHAVSLAQGGDSGVMAALQRRGGGLVADASYELRLGSVPLAEVANLHGQMPREWIDPERPDVTDAFVRYARPLIGEDWPTMELEAGLQRFARFHRHRVTPVLANYVPQNHR